jgi:hypothetical protein
MEQYKEKLKITNIFLALGCLFLVIFAILAVGSELGWFRILKPVAGDSHWKAKWRGFICGASFGLLVFMVIYLIRNLRALRNDAALKKLFIKENDERTAEITRFAQAAAYRTFLSLGLIATIIAGYFNQTVGITILVCIYVGALLGRLYKFYYNKKY